MAKVGDIMTTYALYQEVVLKDNARKPSARTRRAYAALVDAIATDGFTIPGAFGCGGWIPSAEAEPYANLGKLLEASRRARHYDVPAKIANVNHNGAFLGNDAHNLLFRAHHDAIHALYALGFTFEDECRVAHKQARDLMPRITTDAIAVLVWEIIGQGAAYECTGSFPLIDGVQPTVHIDNASVGLALATLKACNPKDEVSL